MQFLSNTRIYNHQFHVKLKITTRPSSDLSTQPLISMANTDGSRVPPGTKLTQQIKLRPTLQEAQTFDKSKTSEILILTAKHENTFVNASPALWQSDFCLVADSSVTTVTKAQVRRW